MPIYSDHLLAAVLYNVQILPETIVSGLILLAILLANPAIVVLAAGTGAAQAIAAAIGTLVMKYSPDGAVLSASMDMCRTGYVGRAWSRLFQKDENLLWHPNAPSVYQATVGFLIGWGGALSQIYKEELSAGVLSQNTLFAMGIVSVLIGALALVFRISSGCERLLGGLAGILIGIILGYFGAVLLAYVSDRRATNIWGIPLLRDRINDGKPVYVCP